MRGWWGMRGWCDREKGEEVGRYEWWRVREGAMVGMNERRMS